MHCLTWRIVVICSALTPLLVNAERYYVTEDSFGGISAEILEPVEAESINTDRAEPTAPDPLSSSESSSSQEPSSFQEPSTPQESPDSLVVEPPSTNLKVEDDSLLIQPEPLLSEKPQIAQGDGLDEEGNAEKDKLNSDSETGQVDKQLSIFEQKYLESERKAKAVVIKNLTGKTDISAEYDATEVNPVDFVDGDELARTGGRKEVEKAPFFTTVDVDGNLQNTFYDPVLINDAMEKQRHKKIEYTQARVYERPESQQNEGLELPEEADPVAVNILSSGEKSHEYYFDVFSSRCCESLPNILTLDINMGHSRAFKLTEQDLSYRFSEGDSRFLLISLPAESDTNYPLRFRTFIRTFRDKGIEHGVFFPQLVTLDAEKKPLRILTGPLLKYQEETWSNHGYLEGIIQIDRENRDERYLLINTTKSVLRQTSTIEAEQVIEIIHMPTGTFELEAMLEE